MITRSLIVLLVALNLGVALWWGLQRPPPPYVPPALPADTPTLRLYSESLSPSDAPASETAPAAAAANAGSGQCYAFGPLDEGFDAAAVARFAASAPVRTPRPEQPRTRAWRVVMPPAADAAAVSETQQKLIAAGFTDLLPISKGEEAWTIALGRFATREAAQRHQAALAAKGFQAQVQPTDAPLLPSIAFELAQTATPDHVRAQLQLLRAETVDCAALVQ